MLMRCDLESQWCARGHRCEPLGPPGPPVATPQCLRAPALWPRCHGLRALQLARLPRGRDGEPIDWAAGIREHWQFGEQGAAAALEEFVECALDRFDAKGAGEKSGGGGPGETLAGGLRARGRVREPGV